MKRALCLFICSSILLTGCGMKDFADKYLHNDLKENQETPQSEENKSEIDKINERFEPKEESDKEFVFEPKEVKGEDILENVPVGKRTIPLHISENMYYDVIIPDATEYITDYSKYIYAVDGSFSISVVTKVAVDNFSECVAIRKPEAVAQNLIISKPGKKGPQEAAVLVLNDKAVVARCYDNETAYEMILSGFEKNTCKERSAIDMVTRDDTTIIRYLPRYTGYAMEVSINIEDQTKCYKFDDGFLTISKEYRTQETAISENTTFIGQIAGTKYIDKLYNNERLGIYYIEVGDWTYGMYKINYNTVYSCVGKGQEARYNTVEFLRAQLH